MALELERSESPLIRDPSGIWTLDDDLESLSVPSPTSATSQKPIVVGAMDEAALEELVDSEVLKGMAADPWMGSDDACARLLPLKTPSDHNCLCHAMALALWGRQDKDCVLRDGIAKSMEADTEAARYFKEQWMHTMLERDTLAFGIEIQRSPEEWVREWREELELAKDLNCSLTEIHVFVLAHIVRRPIIIYSPRFCKDVNGTAFAPIYFAGVYLPVLLSPDQCSARSPVLLTYSQSHFSPLIPCPAGNSDPFAPLVDAEGAYLPAQFVDQTLFAPGDASWRGLLQKYMPVEQPDGQPAFAVRLCMQQQFFLDGQPAPQCERFFAGHGSPSPSPRGPPPSVLRVETEPPSPSSCSSDAAMSEEPQSPDAKGRLLLVSKSSSGSLLSSSLAQKRAFALPAKLGGPPPKPPAATKGTPMLRRSSPAQALEEMRRCQSLRVFPSRAKPEMAAPATPPAAAVATATVDFPNPAKPLVMAVPDIPPGPTPASAVPQPGRLTCRPKVGIVRRPFSEMPLSPTAGTSPTRRQSPGCPKSPNARPASPTAGAAAARPASPFPQRVACGVSMATGSPTRSPTGVSPTFAASKAGHAMPPAIARPRPASPVGGFPDPTPGRRPASPLRAAQLPAAASPERGHTGTSPGHGARALSPQRGAAEDAPPVQNPAHRSPRPHHPAHLDMPSPQNPTVAETGDAALAKLPLNLDKCARSFLRAESGPSSSRKSPLPLQPPARSPRDPALLPTPARMP